MKTQINVAAPATLALDLAHLEILDSQIFPKEPFDQKSYRKWLLSKRHCVHFLRFDGSLIGHGVTEISRTPGKNIKGKILTIGILKHYRGKGLGRRLLVEMEEHLRRKGARFVSLYVSPGSPRSVHRYFERQEYKCARVLYPQGILMSRPLPEMISCPDCSLNYPHTHCPECGSTEHAAADCTQMD